jgi:hypothetical protein
MSSKAQEGTQRSAKSGQKKAATYIWDEACNNNQFGNSCIQKHLMMQSLQNDGYKFCKQYMPQAIHEARKQSIV